MRLDPRWWRAEWVKTAGLATLTITALDAFLLERKYGFFTGGFLSVDHITSAIDAALFLVGSLAGDAAIAGCIVALVLFAAARLRLARVVALPLAFALAVLPLLLADVVSYQLTAYLGDSFDLDVLFQLAGSDPREMFAVSASHLVPLGGVALGVCVLSAALVWTARRRRVGDGARLARFDRRWLLTVIAVLLACGLGVTAVLRASSDVLDNGLRRKPSSRVLGDVVNLLSDVDRDGYGALSRPADPALFDARIRPYAPDVPGNGIDEDGVAGDLPAGTAVYADAAVPPAPWAHTPDVILVVLESFRADVVGAHVGATPVTPVLDALAARGISSAHAYSHNGYTVQSRRHIFSGSLPDTAHGRTLVDDFKANGYETAYFSAQDESFGGIAGEVGFDRADVRYDARDDRDRRYSTFSTPGSLALPYGVVTDRIAAFLASRDSRRPLFLTVNFQDTHFPYYHPAMARLLPAPVVLQGDIEPARAAAVRAMYLNTAANVDRAVGEVLARARAALGHDPAVIVVSDHGESLFDEDFLGHGYALNEAQTRIPLIVAGLPITLAEPVGQVDLRPALNRALSDPAVAGPPLLRPAADRRVFQYIGTIAHPAQIALTGLTGRAMFDFRSNRARVDGRAWQRLDALPAADRARVLAVVHTWERIVLARQQEPAAAVTPVTPQ